MIVKIYKYMIPELIQYLKDCNELVKDDDTVIILFDDDEKIQYGIKCYVEVEK